MSSTSRRPTLRQGEPPVAYREEHRELEQEGEPQVDRGGSSSHLPPVAQTHVQRRDTAFEGALDILREGETTVDLENDEAVKRAPRHPGRVYRLVTAQPIATKRSQHGLHCPFASRQMLRILRVWDALGQRVAAGMRQRIVTICMGSSTSSTAALTTAVVDRRDLGTGDVSQEWQDRRRSQLRKLCVWVVPRTVDQLEADVGVLADECLTVLGRGNGVREVRILRRAWNLTGASDGAINPGPSTVLGCLPTRTPSSSSRVGDDSWGGSCCGQTRALDLPRPSAWWPQPWRLKSARPLVLTATRVPPNEAHPASPISQQPTPCRRRGCIWWLGHATTTISLGLGPLFYSWNASC